MAILSNSLLFYDNKVYQLAGLTLLKTFVGICNGLPIIAKE